jgi:CRISPR/Cas system endoribonuclease Cas6 (RAMP superfamily)
VWDKTIIDRNQMRAVLDDAGKLVGLGDGRSIGFGRFVILSYVVQDY